jgi:hypothetical protein
MFNEVTSLDDEEFEVISPKEFSMSIIESSINSGMNIIDTLVSYCEEKEVDMEDVIPLLDQNIKERIEVCGVQERYITGVKLNKKKLF